MSGETEENVSGWTIDTLHSLMLAMLKEMDLRNSQRFEAQEKAVLAALVAAKEAVGKAEVAQEKRLDSVNEFRGQLADQQATFLPRQEYRVAHDALVDLANRNSDAIIAMGARSGGLNQGWGYLVGVVGLVGAVISVIVLLSR